MTVEFKLNEIQDIIFYWVSAYSKISPTLIENERHIIWEEQDSPQPDSPYITLKIISGPDRVGSSDEFLFDESSHRFSLDGIRSITLSIQVYGTRSHDILSRLQASLEFPEVGDYFRSKMISMYDYSGISDISAELDTVFEKRTHMDVFFYIPFGGESCVSVIEVVEVFRGD
ncbi:MAG: hypothetical protein HRT90_07560 [Candidatus Margulisbacteria bacterium]|nr:hypothetical protein [Candidatus Margulisiibacteriota bacterium]